MAFVLKDSQARGFQRTYSFLLLAKEKKDLMSDWDFYIKHLERICLQLKDKANVVHDSELRQTTCQEKRSIRLNSVAQAGIRRRNPLNTQRSSSKARSLIELTNDNNIFATIHLEFTMILKLSQKWSSNRYGLPLLYESEKPSASISSVSLNSINCSVRWLFNMLGREKFRTAAYHTIVGHQIVLRCKNKDLSKKVLMSLSQLIPKSCVKATFSSQKYTDNRCNLLGIEDPVDISVLNEKMLFIDVIVTEQQCAKCTIHYKGKPVDKLPRFLAQLERMLLDTSISDETLNMYLVNAKEEWLKRANDVKSTITSRRNSFAESTDMFRSFQSEDSHESDLKLMRFWMNPATSINAKLNELSLNSE